MRYKAEIPYGVYWSTPFCKWQGSFAHLHAIEFAAWTAERELKRREVPAEVFDFGVLGITVPQHRSFWGAPWLMGMIGAGSAGGPTISQACATGIRCLQVAAQEIEADLATTALVTGADRVSNGPQLYHPDPQGMGGTGVHENWTLDNFFLGDPLTGQDMVLAAENVAKEWGITTAEQHEVVLRRFEQYQMARAGDAAFQRRYMTLPFEIPNGKFQKSLGELDGDEGIYPSTREKMDKLKPVKEGGTVTLAAQTHPADGNAGVVVTTAERARELSRDPGIRVRLLGFGLARAALAMMPVAPVPATRRALANAGLEMADIDVVKSHNPFAVNDIVFAREMGFDLMAMNNYGSSIVFGHPHAATTLRQVIEMIEELAIRGGGHGLFQGCAAGDTSMAVVIKVGE
jgi:acetyl-CoA acetyltransferase